MGFWIFMLVMNMLIPGCMIVFGLLFRKSAPEKINWVYGYRTSMSMKNQETWKFAHNHFAKNWYKLGWITLIFSVVVMLLVMGKSMDIVGWAGGILCCVQMIPLLVPIFFTERALRQEFDANGNRRG